MTKNKTLKKKKKIINLYGFWHLGDALFCLIYLNSCKDYILKHNITVNYYIKEKHVSQIKEFVACKNIHIKPIIFDKKCNQTNFKKPLQFLNDVLLDFNLCDTNIPENSINTYHGYFSLYDFFLMDLNFLKFNEHITPFNDHLEKYFSKILSKKLGFPSMRLLVNKDTSLLKRYDDLPEKYKNIDILIINSEPQSNQYDLESNRKEFNAMIKTLAKDYKVVTTEKVDNILCSRDNKLTLKDIGAISTHADYIIAINTGPFVACLNKYAFKHVKKWFQFDTRMPFNYGRNWYINKSFDEIIKEINE